MIIGLIKAITKKEWRFLFAISLLIIIITTLPYIYGWQQAPDGYVYTGLHSLTPGDIHVYFSYMEQARQGNFVFEDLYTGESQSRSMVNSFWLAQGLVGKYTGLSNLMVFQLTRIIFIPLFVFVLYLLSSLFWKKEEWRKISLIFMCFASGFGVPISLFLTNSVYVKGWYNWPLDLWAPEANNLLTMFQSPHLILASTLIVLIFLFSYFAFLKNSWRYSIWAGVMSLVLFQFHPFHVPTIFGVLGVYIGVQSILKRRILYRYLKHFFVIFILSLPSLIYYVILIKYDFVTQIRVLQNICLTPSLWVTIGSYGFVLFLAFIAVYYIVKRKEAGERQVFLITWFIVQSILIFSPFNFQRRMIQGLSMPIALLAVAGVWYLYGRFFQSGKLYWLASNKYLLLFLFIFLFTPSHMYNWTRETMLFKDIYPYYYISQEKVEAYEWLSENMDQDDVIISDLYNGNFIPGQSGRKVFIGHAVETLFYESKLDQMEWFYKSDSADNMKLKFLRKEGIDYVFYGLGEKDFGNFNPMEKDYLNLVYNNVEIQVFQVL